MELQDLALSNAKPLEMIHETRWLDALMNDQPSPRVTLPPISSYAGWHTSIAVRPDQMRAAQELIGRRYAWRGYQSHQSAEPGAEHDLRVVLLAQRAGRLMATLTVAPDTPNGLLAEQTYGDVIQKMRRQGHRLGELAKLAIEVGADWKPALDALVQTAYLITRVVHALTDVVIEINPRHSRFYQRIFGFTVAGEERLCERVGAPSVLLRLDLERFGRQLQLAA